MFAALEPELTDCPPFAVGFWNNPKCHKNYLDYFVTELKFLERN